MHSYWQLRNTERYRATLLQLVLTHQKREGVSLVVSKVVLLLVAPQTSVALRQENEEIQDEQQECHPQQH